MENQPMQKGVNISLFINSFLDNPPNCAIMRQGRCAPAQKTTDVFRYTIDDGNGGLSTATMMVKNARSAE
jgi:hypothetical protein